MPILDENKIKTLRNKGLSDEKIQALAQANGFELPKTGFWKGVGQSLIKSETGFGQSIAGALGNVLPASWTGKKQVDTANAQNEQVTTQLLQRIKEKRAKGEDTTRLMSALGTLQKDINFFDILNESTGGSLDKTAKQVFGEGFGVFADIASAGTYSKAGLMGSKAITSGLQRAVPSAVAGMTGAKTFLQGAKVGAKTGAISGSLIGAGQGLTSAMQENKTGSQILGQTIGGGLAGGLTGGIVGGVVGGVSGSVAGRADRKLASQQQSAIDAITPNTKNIPKEEYDRLLSQKRITPKTSTKGSQYVLSEAEKNTATKYSNLLTSKDPVKNHYNILNEIAKQDDAVGSFLEKNNGIFNSGELKNSIKQSLKGITDISIDEKVITKNKTRLVDNFIKNLKSKDMKSLWTARKAFDQEIERSFTGSPTLQNKIKREFRNAVQKFISDKTPDTVYSSAMKEMSNLYKLENLVKSKAITEKGQSAIRLWIKENPIKAKIIGWGVPAVVGSKILLD